MEGVRDSVYLASELSFKWRERTFGRRVNHVLLQPQAHLNQLDGAEGS